MGKERVVSAIACPYEDSVPPLAAIPCRLAVFKIDVSNAPVFAKRATTPPVERVQRWACAALEEE